MSIFFNFKDSFLSLKLLEETRGREYICVQKPYKHVCASETEQHLAVKCNFRASPTMREKSGDRWLCGIQGTESISVSQNERAVNCTRRWCLQRRMSSPGGQDVTEKGDGLCSWRMGGVTRTPSDTQVER